MVRESAGDILIVSVIYDGGDNVAAEGNTIELRTRLDVQKAVVAHKNRRTSKNPFMIINIVKRGSLSVW